MVSAYERERVANIARNKAMLEALGLDKPFFNKPAVTTKKRKAPATETNISSAKASKVARSDSVPSDSAAQDSGDISTNGTRRSQRNRGKTVDYKTERRESAMPMTGVSKIKVSEDSGPPGREGGIRKHNPKVFGSIPGVEVGTWWETREGCSVDAIHAPWVAGISGGAGGAFSVALSGGYDDDVDLGYGFTYTGSGGRDLKGTKAAPKNLRTAPQSSDQTFENPFNKALQKSAETKKPVRVIRGFKLKSPYAPNEGYRYDGLYTVEKAWLEKGLNPHGYLVCKFAFKRIPNQPALPLNQVDSDTGDQKEDTATPAAQDWIAESDDDELE